MLTRLSGLRFEADPNGDPPAGAGAPDPGTPDPQATPPAPTFDPSQFATREDFSKLEQNLNYLVQMFQDPGDDPDPDPGQQQGDEIDIDAYVQGLVQRQMAPVRPLLDATVKERGEKEMQKIFTRMKDELKTDFDHELAERVANSFLAEHGGDPVKATEEGARYAAEVRKREREAGETGYRERLQRGPAFDFGVEGGGQQPKPKFKSYDEVTEYYAGETEA